MNHPSPDTGDSLARRMEYNKKHDSSAQRPNSKKTSVVLRIRVPRSWRAFAGRPLLMRLWRKISGRYVSLRRKQPVATRLGLGILAALMVFTVTISVVEFKGPNYELTAKAQTLLDEPLPHLAQSIELDKEAARYNYNKGYNPGIGVSGQVGSPKFSASFDLVPQEGATVTDPVNQVSITFKPQYRMAEPKPDQNRLVYPLKGRDAQKVYTLRTIGFKEDIILNSYQGDTAAFTYKLKLDSGTEARMEPDGSLSIYGVDQMLLGDVSAASEEDQELLEKARQNGEKNNLLFSFPAPFVKEYGKKKSDIETWFELDGDKLTLHAAGLKDASYPLSIDPSVYVETAAKLMRGNNETNIDFDVENELIRKGSTTGARFDSLDPTMSLPEDRWNHGTTVAGGFIYVVGGSDGSDNQSTVYWARLHHDNYTISSPNPGDGVCGSWCTDSAYDLPDSRAGLSLVAYNGYLYAIGGTDSSCSGTLNACDTVYIAKLGANGEPSLWHPTDPDPDNWDYWYVDTSLNTERSYAAAVAYDNRMYLLGGQTNADAGGVDTVEYADIRPTGALTSWTSTGMTTLPSARFGHDAHVYNDRLYLVGGNSGGILQDTVDYIKIRSDGTLVDSWSSANDFSTARMSWGGNFSAIWGGYLYIMGGCAAVDTGGECTSAGITDGGLIELVSINADGSLAFWGEIGNIAHSRIGYGLAAWRNTIYSIGGCTAQDTSTGACTASIDTTHYGIVNNEGDASTVATSVDNTTAPCNNTEPRDCDLPGTSHVGNMLSATAITNGYLYVIGGCTNDDCTNTSGNVAYTAINADGSLARPASCPGGAAVDSYCVDSTNTISGGVAAAGTAVFGGRIYVIGGQDGSGLKGNIYHVEVNNDGSLEGGWTAQSFVDVGATSVSHTFAYARANPSSAGTHPGNLFIFGGCTATSGGAECDNGAYTDAVYKCGIRASGNLEDSGSNQCATADQLQIGAVPGASGSGLALHAGTVYADYVYLVGGVAPGLSDMTTVRYAKIDNNNNIVPASGSEWIEAQDSSNNPIEMSVGRIRGAAFGHNGYLYAVGGYDGMGSGTASDIQFAKINVNDGSIGLFNTSVVTLGQRWGVSVPVSNSYAYVIGGCTDGASPGDCSERTDVIQTFQIYNNDSGSPAGYSSSANLFPTDRFGAGATILNGYIYVAGGCVGVLDCDVATDVVEYAPLRPDGVIDTWSTATAPLPASRVYGQLEEAGGTLYYIGGQDDSRTAQSTIYYATPDGSGDVSSWSTASGGIGDTSSSSAVARTQFGATVWNDRIYVLGGYDEDRSSTDTVFISPQLSSGGDIPADSWMSSTVFNVARNGLTAIAYANNLYLLGGHDGINFLSDVQYAQISSDGTLGSWSYSTSLPRNVSHSDGFAANGYMYLFGGKQSAIHCTSNTYVAPISANTTVDTGNNPTGLGAWFQTSERFSAERANLSAVYHEGKTYLMGGSCGTLEGGEGDVVVEDDFDADIDMDQWSSVQRMNVGTACGTLSSGNALVSIGNQGGTQAQAQTIDVDVSYGGTVSFYLRIPTSGGGSCAAPGANRPVLLQYSTNSGAGWTTMATYDSLNFDTPTQITETIAANAWTENTRFRWVMPNGRNNQDHFAIDDVVVTANATPPLDEMMFDDFDPTDMSQWSNITDMTESTTCGVLSSGDALVSTGGGGAQAVTNNHNLQFGGRVSFYMMLSTDSGAACRQPGNNQHLLLQYSHNNGSTWTTMVSYDKSDYGGVPVEISTALPPQAFSSTVRFRWIIPNANSDSVWAIDDVMIEAFEPILTYTGIHRAVSTALLSQPQIAMYSRLIDTDTDVFPTHWLLNGVDNFIGARWTLRYRTMHDTDGTTANCGSTPMNTWGQETDFGEVTLGQPEEYIPLDDSGSNIDCARYYYIHVTVDSSQAFGYPDDVTRGPTVTDMSLFFTSDPSKRLRHGSTFTGGERQPYDTPF